MQNYAENFLFKKNKEKDWFTSFIADILLQKPDDYLNIFSSIPI